jgi:regulator of cell morphogenesis and NO signaling
MNSPKPDLSARSVGDVAANLPGATSVFRKYRIEFCCAGDDSLADAAERHSVDMDALVQELQSLDSQARMEWPTATEELIQFILERYHHSCRHDLPELIGLARMVEGEHGDHPRVPLGLAATYTVLHQELEQHMQKEEQILFPAMLAGAEAMLSGPIRVMRHEHDEAAAALAELVRMTNDFQLPQNACSSWRTLYRLSRKFVEDLQEHIHLENNVLFPRFAQHHSEQSRHVHA